MLEQTEVTYDKNGNPTLVASRQRFHDAVGTGALAGGGSARTYFAASYYDALDRVIASVDVGTNGGSSYTRPEQIPGRSDSVHVTEYAYNDAGWLEAVTGPRGIVDKTFYDALGRTSKTIEAFTGSGTPTNSTNKTTEFGYDASKHLVELTAHQAGGLFQKTAWIYGVTTGGGGSAINSNDLLREVWHPSKSGGVASSAEKDSYTVNARGETLTAGDRNGSVHTYSYDVVGRPIADAVTTLGTGVDPAVRRLETRYDTAGLADQFTSFDAAVGGNIVNQVRDEFNGLGQLTTEYQAHQGGVVAATPRVQYSYAEMANGVNHSRPLGVSYPTSKVVYTNYGTGGGLDDRISRPTDLRFTALQIWETYTYLGLGTVVRRGQPQTGADLTYIKRAGEANGDGGDQYTGLDRFGRIIEQRWRNVTTGDNVTGFAYGYDRDDNRLLRKDLVNAAFSEIYHASGSTTATVDGYDPLGQLVQFRRGTLNAANNAVSGSGPNQQWTLDAQGNWQTLVSSGSSQARTHNQQNQVTMVGGAALDYDANGNLTKDAGKLKNDGVNRWLVYDAWNRLVEVRLDVSPHPVQWRARYDALGRKLFEEDYTAAPTRQRKELYYSDEWQILEERIGPAGQVATKLYTQTVWSLVYVDAMVLRERDADGNGALDERLYVQQDANFNVVALVNTLGQVVERYAYEPYGAVAVLDPNYGAKPAGSSYEWRVFHQGGRYEAVTGLYNFRNRELSPTLGRWIEVDPWGFGAGDTNFYRVERNGPTSRLDPSGLVAAPPPQLDPEGQRLWRAMWRENYKVPEPPTFLEWIRGENSSKWGDLERAGGQSAQEALHEVGEVIKELAKHTAEYVIQTLVEQAIVGPATAKFLGWALKKGWKLVQKGSQYFLKTCEGELKALPKGFCFVAGTPVLVPSEDALAGSEVACALAEPDSNRDWLLAGAAVAVGLAGGLKRTKRKRDDEAEQQDSGKLLYEGEPVVDNDWQDVELGRNPLRPHVPGLGHSTVSMTRLDSYPALVGEGKPVASIGVAPMANGRMMATEGRSDARSIHPTALVGTSALQSTRDKQSGMRGSWLARGSVLWLAAWLLLAAGLAGKAWWSAGRPTPASMAVVPLQAVASRPIEALRVGDRVLTDSAKGDSTPLEPGATQVDPATWRRLRLRAESLWEDGTLDVVEVETLQAPSWVAEHRASIGAVVPLPLDLREMGLPESLLAEVVADDPCPNLQQGPGRLVLTTVSHLNRDVWELTLEDDSGRREVVRPTGRHRFYSGTRQGWVAAEELQQGEWLSGSAGPVRVVAAAAVPGVQRVYNLTVEGEHVYRVSALGVMAQNNGCAVPGAGAPKAPVARPSINTRLPNRVTEELPAGQIRTPQEVARARNFFERNREAAQRWWAQRNGVERWPERSTHAEHPRPLANGGDPLFIEPGYGGPSAPHMVPGPDGLTDFQRWGQRGGRPPK